MRAAGGVVEVLDLPAAQVAVQEQHVARPLSLAVEQERVEPERDRPTWPDDGDPAGECGGLGTAQWDRRGAFAVLADQLAKPDLDTVLVELMKLCARVDQAAPARAERVERPLGEDLVGGREEQRAHLAREERVEPRAAVADDVVAVLHQGVKHIQQ